MAFDFDLFVIGAGSGGVRAARFAAGFGARVAVAESRYLGGTCVNVGCVPKKLLVYGAHFSEDFEQARGFGWNAGEPAFDWPTLIANKNREIERLNGIYRNLLVNSGVTLLEGHARIQDPHTVEVNGKTLQRRPHPGGHGRLAPGAGHSGQGTCHHLERGLFPRGAAAPRAGGGRRLHRGGIRLDLQRHGRADRAGLSRPAVPARLRPGRARAPARRAGEKGVDLRFNAEVARIDKRADGTLAATLKDGSVIETDCVFYATGRRPMLDNLGLENTAVRLKDDGFIQVDDEYRTAEPSILAIGDVIGRVPLTPVALAEGMAVARRLFRPEEYRKVDYQLIPTAVFSLPNIGTVGMTTEEARAAGHRIKLFESRFRPMKLTLTESQEKTLMKLIVDADTDRVLGVHMVGPDAGEIIQGIAVALKAGATKQVFDETIGIHPTAAEEFVTLRTPVAQ